ncbi:ATP-dependent nuclease subunit B [Streptococcus entericus]|uniref:ATP-dependent nuclease subunit B n=1 Tax=Streptococcus entericus TaxID=155680 RepID=UPI000374013E|nr:ATP-dependent nuclease subunit B [Streptococcus entericus]
MKLVYTDLANDLTQLLAQQAQSYADAGKRVFYIAPNSLSFEKERRVLEYLPSRASFAITVTRFGQMARYLTLSRQKGQKTIDELGLTLVIYRVLAGLTDGELRRYQLLGTDPAFIAQLVDFYKEWQSSDLDLAELAAFESDKLSDICLIMEKVNEALVDLDFSTQSTISQLRDDIEAGLLTEDLAQVVVLIDGFTRFTATEKALIHQLNQICHEVMIGTYASQSAYKSPYQAGQLYQASVEFLRQLAEEFATKPTYMTLGSPETFFSRVTAQLENSYAYRDVDSFLTDDDKARIQIWQASGIKEELELVAQSIRQKLDEGYRYKDMLVLLGDVEAYQLQLGQVFSTYAIPYYLGQAESMADHPLVHVVDSLERLYRYQFRAEDVLNLIQSGLVGQLDQMAIDQFDRYVSYALIRGKKGFSEPFVKTNGRFDLDQLNQTRQAIMNPLLAFMQADGLPVENVLEHLLGFFESVDLRHHLAALASTGSQQEAEKHEQVWKTFCALLEQLQLIFAKKTLPLMELLGLLRAGMLAATYRIVPATLDVVNIKSYNLIEPHTKPFVFAIGLSQSNFPEIVKNVSLLSDEERLSINAHLTIGELDLPGGDNLKRNNYTMVSLLNAATQELVLSSPTMLGETEDTASTYMNQLAELGLPVVHHKRSYHSPVDVATYRSLLSRLVEAYQTDLELDQLDKTSADYWSVLIRRLRRKMAEQGLVLPEVSADVVSRPLSPETLAVRYPRDSSLRLSASSLSDFYNNEYKFFLTHVLRLQEEDSILPDARQHGIFFHRVFELVTADKSKTDFDVKLDRALEQASQEPEIAMLYQQSAQTRFAHDLMTSMIRQTAQVLKEQSPVDIVGEELNFSFTNQKKATLSGGRELVITGKMDRLDRLSDCQSYGVVDYKSSDQRFKLSDFYNRLSPQLLTYVAALKQSSDFAQVDDVFGAMYLQVHQPLVALSKATSTADLLAAAHQDVTYKGLFITDQTNLLDQRYSSKNNTYTQDELATLLEYNAHLYKQAAESILSGHFAINPYTRDGRSVAGDQLKSITRFEADLHLGQARRLQQFPRTDQRKLIFEAMAEELAKEKEDHHA